MAICYLIYTLSGWEILDSFQYFFVLYGYLYYFFQCSTKEAALMMFFNIIITYIYIALYAVSTTDLLPFIPYNIYEPPIMCQSLGK